MLRSFPGIILDNNFTLVVVQVMHGGSRMMIKGVSTVIDGCALCMYICVYLYNSYPCSLFSST